MISLVGHKTHLKLAAQVHEAEGVNLARAQLMIQDVRDYGPASQHWDTVAPYLMRWLTGMLSGLRAQWEAVDSAIAEEARDGIAAIERHLKD